MLICATDGRGIGRSSSSSTSSSKEKSEKLMGKSPQNGTERVSVTSAKTFFFPLKIGQK